MSEIHCHNCGGFITDPASVSYRLPSDGAGAAAPHAAPCTCSPSVVYGPPPGYLAWPGLGSIERRRAAASARALN